MRRSRFWSPFSSRALPERPFSTGSASSLATRAPDNELSMTKTVIFADEVIDNYQHAEAPSDAELIGNEVEVQRAVRPPRQRRQRLRSDGALASATTTHGETLLAVAAEQLLFRSPRCPRGAAGCPAADSQATPFVRQHFRTLADRRIARPLRPVAVGPRMHPRRAAGNCRRDRCTGIQGDLDRHAGAQQVRAVNRPSTTISPERAAPSW